jgi:hypothetical protein
MAGFARSFPTAKLSASDCLTMGSSVSHEGPSLMCEEYGQTWRGRRRQAVQNQATGEPVVVES